ncbi:CBS domain-containing protein [Phycicoccus sp. 3266]|uniref:CBS domain-containing protein n=1 Tax=Phycicoccus sp. 3266 TaxID=2817751 RepID=UPI00285AEE5B|nr:CBS domain-containing protein [Phycicoccus sp. 3266]MDR6862694.1 CBS domain-containing protein [Phycicoccus sp. 3266]
MTTARDVMTGGAECAGINDTVTQAAQKMRDLGVGALPICGDDNRLTGMITDRDIVLNCVAEGMNANQVRVGDYAGDEVVTVGADDDIEKALSTMARHGVRRLPVIDGQDLVGMISQADIAKNLPEESAGRLVEAISAAPSTD